MDLTAKNALHRALAAAALLLALFAALAAPSAWARDSRDTLATKTATKLAEIPVAELPPEARHTIDLVRKGGPFPYDRDGIVFGNFERRLPVHPRGYYQEYTVKTPGAKNRGARRIIRGKSDEFYYTDDHYESFKRVDFRLPREEEKK